MSSDPQRAPRARYEHRPIEGGSTPHAVVRGTEVTYHDDYLTAQAIVRLLNAGGTR